MKKESDDLAYGYGFAFLALLLMSVFFWWNHRVYENYRPIERSNWWQSRPQFEDDRRQINFKITDADLKGDPAALASVVLAEAELYEERAEVGREEYERLQSLIIQEEE